MRFLLLLVLFLSGCAASPHRLGWEALNRSDWSAAERHLTIAIRQGDSTAWNDLGFAYQRQGKTQQAIDAYTMAARYGDPTARSNLALSKLPIPPADLVGAKPASSTDGIAAGLEGFNRGYNGGMNCTTIGFDDLKQTRCR